LSGCKNPNALEIDFYPMAEVLHKEVKIH